MEEIHNKHLKTYAEIIDRISELSHNHRQFVNSATGKFYFIFLAIKLMTLGDCFDSYKFCRF